MLYPARLAKSLALRTYIIPLGSVFDISSITGTLLETEKHILLISTTLMDHSREHRPQPLLRAPSSDIIDSRSYLQQIWTTRLDRSFACLLVAQSELLFKSSCKNYGQLMQAVILNGVLRGGITSSQYVF